MTQPRTTLRVLLSLSIAFAVVSGACALPGCGEKEAPVIPSSKKKDDLQKDIENPYGVELKAPKAVKRRGRG